MTPFKGHKGEAWEGGYRAPMVIRWPGVIKPGTVKNDMFASLDWLPTLVDIAGGPKGDGLKKQIEGGTYPGIVKTHARWRSTSATSWKASRKSRHAIRSSTTPADPSAVRYKNWKMYYTMVQTRGGGLAPAADPLHWTLVSNIKRDPFELAVGLTQKTRDEHGRCNCGPVHRLYLRLEHAADRPAAVAEGARVAT